MSHRLAGRQRPTCLVGGEGVLDMDGPRPASHLPGPDLVGYIGKVVVDTEVEHAHVHAVRDGQR
ncbi:MAG: hypothetical protein JWN84_2435 [Nocardioides sp.]|nr:hypothetical protein [Nocardioides sp.]